MRQMASFLSCFFFFFFFFFLGGGGGGDAPGPPSTSVNQHPNRANYLPGM